MNNILTRIGSFGRFQQRILAIIGSITILVAFVSYVSIFNVALPEVTCNNTDTNEFYDSVNYCKIWNNTDPNRVYECKNDETYYGRTIVTEWKLYCNKYYLANLTQTLFMVGAFFSFLAGSFSDKYGRKTVCVFMLGVLSFSITLCGVLQHPLFGLSENLKYIIYAITQFMLGFSSFTLYVVGYVLLIEISSSDKSMLMSVININLYVLGEIILLAICYFFRDWHMHNWAISVYSFTILGLMIMVLPESPKFLIANKRYKEAADILTRISKVNGTNLSITEKDILVEMNNSEAEKMIPEKTELSIEEKEEMKNKLSVASYLTKPLRNLLQTCMLGYLFAAMSMIYFGISLGITQISDSFDPYFMYLLSSVSEFIGYSMGMLDRKFSRKTIMVTSLGCAGVSCLSVALIPLTKEPGFSFNSFLIISSASFGKIMGSAAFNLIYLYAAQFFPTEIRNTLVLFVTCAGRVGALLSPQINLGALLWKPLPYIVFSANAFISCVVVFFMPDSEKIKHDI